MARRWPAASEYMGAVQQLERTFVDPRIRTGRWVPGWMGLPACASGQNAVVFPIELNGTKVAVKCFTSGTGDSRRYEALAKHLERRPCGVFADATWREDGVRIAGESWPIVTMAWLEGRCLHEWIADRLSEPDRISALAQRWRKAVAQLGTAGIAHGDLQHGNILIGSRSSIRLVDYDGIWVQEIADVPPHEVGHPNYQHPQRRQVGTWGEHIDWFSALVIYTSLRAIAADPGLWDTYHNGENLILTATDYQNPGTTPIWAPLAQNPDSEVAALTQLLRDACGADPSIPATLDTLLDTKQLLAPQPLTTKPTLTTKDDTATTWWGNLPTATDTTSGTRSRSEPEVEAVTSGPSSWLTGAYRYRDDQLIDGTVAVGPSGSQPADATLTSKRQPSPPERQTEVAKRARRKAWLVSATAVVLIAGLVTVRTVATSGPKATPRAAPPCANLLGGRQVDLSGVAAVFDTDVGSLNASRNNDILSPFGSKRGCSFDAGPSFQVAVGSFSNPRDAHDAFGSAASAFSSGGSSQSTAAVPSVGDEAASTTYMATPALVQYYFYVRSGSVILDLFSLGSGVPTVADETQTAQAVLKYVH
jgi:predicted Ser/Thr protein kinase